MNSITVLVFYFIFDQINPAFQKYFQQNKSYQLRTFEW